VWSQWLLQHDIGHQLNRVKVLLNFMQLLAKSLALTGKFLALSWVLWVRAGAFGVNTHAAIAKIKPHLSPRYLLRLSSSLMLVAGHSQLCSAEANKFIPRSYTSVGHQLSFCTSGPAAWNDDMQASVRNSDRTLNDFGHSLKTVLFQRVKV